MDAGTPDGATRERGGAFDATGCRIERTAWGVWRRHIDPAGGAFTEFRSHRSLLSLPLIHFTRGRDPATGRRVVARGVLAVGRIAVGGVAIGQASAGIVAFGQAAAGAAFGLGQAAVGLYAAGQLALGVTLGIGQLALAETAIGQLAVGRFVLAQAGAGQHAWTPGHADPEAVAHFRALRDQALEMLETLRRRESG